MPAVTVIGPGTILHNGELYQPGEVIVDITKEQAKILVDGGAAVDPAKAKEIAAANLKVAEEGVAAANKALQDAQGKPKPTKTVDKA